MRSGSLAIQRDARAPQPRARWTRRRPFLASRATERARPTSCSLARTLLAAGLLALSAPGADAGGRGQTFDPTFDPARLDDFRQIQGRVQKALAAAARSTVGIRGSWADAEDPEGSSGTGVIVSEDGLILTAAHVATRWPSDRHQIVLHDGRVVEAETLGRSFFADAGVLKIAAPGPWPHSPMASQTGAAAGEWCFALGHPGGFDSERGPVLRVGRVISKLRNILQSDCSIVGGDSGGPLFNLKGEVVGIHSRVTVEDIDDNFHAPIEAFHRHWDDLLASQDIPKSNGRGGTLGRLQLEPHNDGLAVTSLPEASPAALAGVKAGDIITHVNGYVIELESEFDIAVLSAASGEEVEIQLLRDGAPQTLRVELGDRPRRRGRRR